MGSVYSFLHFILLTAAFLVLVCSLIKLTKQDKPALESANRWASWIMAGCAAISMGITLQFFFLLWYNDSTIIGTTFFGRELNSNDHYWQVLAITLLPTWLCLLPAIRQIRQVSWLTALICGIILAMNLASYFA